MPLKMNTRYQAHKPVKSAATGADFRNELVKRVKLRQHAKFRGDRSNRRRDMAIFRFFKMAAAVILDFSNLKFLMVGRLKKADLHRRAKFGRNRSNRGRDMAIFQFFQDGGCPPSWICYVCVFGPPTEGIWWSLSLCKIWLESMQ